MLPAYPNNFSQYYTLSSYLSRQITPVLGTMSYSIESGDTLYVIAKKFNTTVANILKFNYIPNPELIYTGRVLSIPVSPPEAIIYTVQHGDTLSSIALKFGTQLENLIKFNYLSNPNLVFPGQQLVVTASLK